MASLQVVAEDISTNNGYVELSFRAQKLNDKVRVGGPPGGWAAGVRGPQPSMGPASGPPPRG